MKTFQKIYFAAVTITLLLAFSSLSYASIKITLKYDKANSESMFYYHEGMPNTRLGILMEKVEHYYETEDFTYHTVKHGKKKLTIEKQTEKEKLFFTGKEKILEKEYAMATCSDKLKTTRVLTLNSPPLECMENVGLKVLLKKPEDPDKTVTFILTMVRNYGAGDHTYTEALKNWEALESEKAEAKKNDMMINSLPQVVLAGINTVGKIITIKEIMVTPEEDFTRKGNPKIQLGIYMPEEEKDKEPVKYKKDVGAEEEEEEHKKDVGEEKEKKYRDDDPTAVVTCDDKCKKYLNPGDSHFCEKGSGVLVELDDNAPRVFILIEIRDNEEEKENVSVREEVVTRQPETNLTTHNHNHNIPAQTSSQTDVFMSE